MTGMTSLSGHSEDVTYSGSAHCDADRQYAAMVDYYRPWVGKIHVVRYKM